MSEAGCCGRVVVEGLVVTDVVSEFGDEFVMCITFGAQVCVKFNCVVNEGVEEGVGAVESVEFREEAVVEDVW